MRKRNYKLLSLLLTLALIIGLCQQCPLTVKADTVSYNINEINHNITISDPGTYVINGNGTSTTNKIIVDNASGSDINITINHVKINALSVTGSAISITSGAVVKLTLIDTNTLISGNSYAGLGVPAGANLTIEAASTGSLTATGGYNAAGIGGGDFEAGGNVTINGGTVTANGDANASGIGGGYYGAGGTVTISGGTVTARGSAYASGIGGGDHGNGGTVTISGGTVTANGGTFGSGIGGGNYGNGGSVSISGGNVTAIAGSSGAAIGGGNRGNGGSVSISGGNVIATGSSFGSGIGGGSWGAGANVNISGGNVTASCGVFQYSIGSGSSSSTSGTIIISGGSVNATVLANTATNGTSPVTLNTYTYPTLISTTVTYTLDGGAASLPVSTDSSGKLYLWLTSGAHTVKIVRSMTLQDYSTSYTGSNIAYGLTPVVAPALESGESIIYSYYLSSSDRAGNVNPVTPKDPATYYVRASITGSALGAYTAASADATMTITKTAAPSAPTGGTVNDTANTFGFTVVPGDTNLSSYEYSTDGGTNWTTVTVNPISVGNLNIVAGNVKVRLKETPTRIVGAILSSSETFTVTSGTPSTPTPIPTSTPTPIPTSTPTSTPTTPTSPTSTPTSIPSSTPVPTLTPTPSVEKNKDKDIIKIDLTKKDITSSDGIATVQVPIKELIKDLSDSSAPDVNVILKPSKELEDNKDIAGLILDSTVLEAAKASGKNLQLSIADEQDRELYTWNFEATKLSASSQKLTDVNLSMERITTTKDTQLKEIFGDNVPGEGIVFKFAHEGILPAQASVRIYVGDQEGFLQGKQIYLYHDNKATGKLEALPYGSTYTVDSKGYVTINIVHCSDYVALFDEAKGSIVTKLKDQITVSPTKKTLYVGENKNKSFNIKITLPTTLELVNSLKDTTSQSAIGGVTVKFTSSNKKVATVNKKGKITAIKAGTTTITTTLRLYDGTTRKVSTTIIVKKSHTTLVNKASTKKADKVVTH